MPFSYTNRRGDTYYLHKAVRKNSKTAYVMKKKPGKGAIEGLPAGYEVSESVSGVVSVRRPPKRIITETEEDLVQSALQHHDRGQYRHEIKGHRIVFFEPLRDPVEMCEGFSRVTGLPPEAFRARLEERLQRTQRYEAVLRFTLVDRKARTFMVERMRYSGMGAWLPVDGGISLKKALSRYVRHLGRDSFFEMGMMPFG